jgi:two-component system response regulator YesN
MNNAQARKKSLTILLVDPDAQSYYWSLGTIMQDCRVIIEKSKQKACEFFFHNDVDLVLLDHTPDDPCLDLLQVFRFVAPSLPVIIMTAYGSEELAVTVFRNGANDYLRKPLTIDELRRRIKAAFVKNDMPSRKISDQSGDGIDKAIQYINTNYCLPLRLARVAQEAGMSVSSLGRIFKKAFSVTFSMYLNKVRIARAIDMLERRSGLSMGEIAFACGFTNQYHFTRMFKKMTKTCPRDFKRALVGNSPRA